MKNKISFTWNLLFSCNYRCTYCWFHNKWHKLARHNRVFSVKELARFWEGVYKNYATVSIDIIGGEPFLYPNFIELIKEISNFHTVSIVTNLSADIKKFAKEVDSSKVNIAPTFHPLFAKIDNFLEKMQLLKQNGFGSTVSYLAYPGQLELLKFYRKKIEQSGLSFVTHSFWGEYKGVSYPQGYAEEEREIINSYLLNKGKDNEKLQLTPKKIDKTKLCRAGEIYAVIHPDGRICRCGNTPFNETLGNITEDNFRLLDSPQPCNSESGYCPCNEWASLLVKDGEKDGIHYYDRARYFSSKVATSLSSTQHQKQSTIPKFPRLVSPHYKVYWSWEITYECNYRCSYCIFWKEYLDRYPYVGIEKLRKFWDGMFYKYGCCHIRFGGGEPTVYPYFIDLIEILLEKHTIDITTNLTFDVDYFLKKIKPGPIYVSPSFHPECIDINTFLDKVILLHDKGFTHSIAFVAYPPFLEQMDEFRKNTEEKGIEFKIIPFKGKFEGRQYPGDYTEQERNLLKETALKSLSKSVNLSWFEKDVSSSKEENKEIRNTKGKLCRMGEMYALIRPDGKIYRCCASNTQILGSIFDDNFRLFDEPEICESDNCPCYRSMLVGYEEDKWSPHWRTPEHNLYKNPVLTNT